MIKFLALNAYIKIIFAYVEFLNKNWGDGEMKLT